MEEAKYTIKGYSTLSFSDVGELRAALSWQPLFVVDGTRLCQALENTSDIQVSDPIIKANIQTLIETDGEKCIVTDQRVASCHYYCFRDEVMRNVPISLIDKKMGKNFLLWSTDAPIAPGSRLLTLPKREVIAMADILKDVDTKKCNEDQAVYVFYNWVDVRMVYTAGTTLSIPWVYYSMLLGGMERREDFISARIGLTSFC